LRDFRLEKDDVEVRDHSLGDLEAKKSVPEIKPDL
jgi:hypothetical protein